MSIISTCVSPSLALLCCTGCRGYIWIHCRMAQIPNCAWKSGEAAWPRKPSTCLRTMSRMGKVLHQWKTATLFPLSTKLTHAQLISISIAIAIYLYLSISIYLSYLILSLSCLILSNYLSIYPSIHPCIHLSVYKYIYIYISLSLSLWVSYNVSQNNAICGHDSRVRSEVIWCMQRLGSWVPSQRSMVSNDVQQKCAKPTAHWCSRRLFPLPEVRAGLNGSRQATSGTPTAAKGH